MVNVDVYVPSLDETPDFKLDENAPVSQLLDEMTEILAKRAKEDAGADLKGFLLCIPREKRVLPAHLTLQQCGVKNGDRLMLI